MNRPGTAAKATGAFLAVLIAAIDGTVKAPVAPGLGGDEAAERLEATVAEARRQRGEGHE